MRAELLACMQALRGQSVVCAVSGGADSVALLHGLWSVREELSLRLSAAHYNHGLRENAAMDEDFVRALCDRLKIPLTVGRGDVRGYAGEHGMSVEEAARTLRYEFLLSREGYIAVAHNADDQVETVLLNLLRGTGLKGLCGMERQMGRIVRPLLSVTRSQIEDYLMENGLSHREDESNAQDDALRNRLRHHVVPLLKKENPALAGTVGRMTALLQHDEAFLQAETDALIEKAEKDGGYDCRVLKSSRLCQRAIRTLLEISKPSMAHVQEVEKLLADTSGTKEIHLPSMTVRREYDIVYFGTEADCELPEPVTATLTKGGCVLWGGWKISWKDDACGSICVRGRRPGDTIKLPGGTKTVKKLLIDKKVPSGRRNGLPIVVFEDAVVAVADLAVSVNWINIEERKI